MEGLIWVSMVIYIITLSLFSCYSIMGRRGKETPAAPDYLLYILLGEALITGFIFTYVIGLDGVLPNNFVGWLKWIFGAIIAGGIVTAFAYYLSFIALYIGLIVPFMTCVFILNELFGIDVSFEKTDSYYKHFDMRIAIIAGVNVVSFVTFIVALLVK